MYLLNHTLLPAIGTTNEIGYTDSNMLYMNAKQCQ